MITKAYSKDGKSCKVTFELSPDFVTQHGAKTIHLAGEFNDWNYPELKLTKRKTGGFYTTVKLDAGKSYQFRYVVNESEWVNDNEADAYASNGAGEDNSVVNV